VQVRRSCKLGDVVPVVGKMSVLRSFVLRNDRLIEGREPDPFAAIRATADIAIFSMVARSAHRVVRATGFDGIKTAMWASRYNRGRQPFFVPDSIRQRGTPMADVDETRQCPYCKELIKSEAVKCKHCGSAVSPERPSHGGSCPYCKEQVHPEAIKCKHCKSSLVAGSPGDCGCNKGQESLLRQAVSRRLPATGTSLTQSASSALLGAQRSGNHIILGGPLDPHDPLPCEGHYECGTICLPFLGCRFICVWVCEIF
jgi:Double zinc ribbon